MESCFFKWHSLLCHKVNRQVVTDSVGRLGEIHKHCILVGVLSLGVVPDSVAVDTICVLVYQHVTTHTCIYRAYELLSYAVQDIAVLLQNS